MRSPSANVVATATLMALVAIGCFVLGVLTAFLVVRVRLPMRRMWWVLACLPLAIPSYVAAFVWLSAFPTTRGLRPLALALVLTTVPFVTIATMSALSMADNSLADVARTLGRSPAQAFATITLPQILPAALAGTLLSGLYALSDFGAPAMLRHQTLTVGIHGLFEGTLNRQIAASMSILPVAHLAARYRGRVVTLIESASFIGYALPGVVVALALVFLGLAPLPWAYQSAGMLVFAYAVLFLPQAIGSARSGFEQVPVGTEDTSRTLGRGPVATWWRVSAQQAWPGIAAGGLLVMVSVMKELPATLMLRPIGAETLSTQLWTMTSIGAYGAAAPIALILVLVGVLLAMVGLAEFGSRMPHQLSGGERQRVALARALAPTPALVLLDEPFSSLDTALRDDVRTQTAGVLRAQDVPAILITHDQNEALSMSDRVAVLRGGAIMQMGTPHAATHRPATRWVAEFVGESVIVSGVRESRDVQTPLGRVRVAAPGASARPGAHVDVLLRPEQIGLAPRPSASDGGRPPAVIRDLRYFGHDQLARVELLDGTMVMARSPTLAPWQVGDGVAITVVGQATC